MRQTLFLLVLSTFVSMNAGAQGWDSPEFGAMIRSLYKQFYEVKGKVYGVDDFEPNPYPLQGANIKVTCVGDTTETSGMAAQKDGDFTVYLPSRDRLKDTRVRVVISYVGMQTYDKVLTPVKSKEHGLDKYTVSLDSLVLQSDPLTLAEAEVVAELKRMYQRGDTVIFNAGAYEMPSGSVLLDLVRRLPGLAYKDGKLTYLGKDIKEIKLNGDSFFKRDMSIALNNMPHDKLKSLKVYEVPDDTLDVRSDNHLVMDMETKEKMNTVLFGEATAGTTEEVNHYLFTGNLSSWKKGGSQSSLALSTQDIPSEGTYQLKTVNTYGNLFYDQPVGNTHLTANVGYNYTHNENKSDSYNRLFMPDYTQSTSGEQTSGNKGRNYSGSVSANGSFSQRFRWNADLSLNKSDDDSHSLSTDSISNEGEGLVSATRQSNTSHTSSKNANGSFSFNYALDEDGGDNISASLNLGRNEGESTQFNHSYSRFVQLNDSVRDVNHRITAPSRGNSGSINVNYNKSMGKHTFLSLDYQFRYSGNKSLQNYEDMHGDGSYSQVDSLHYDKRDKEVSNTIGLSYFYNNDTLRANTYVNIEPTHRSIDNDQYGKKEDITSNGLRYNVGADLRFKWGKNQYGVHYSGSNQLPDVASLSSVVDYSDPMNISSGNPGLKSAFNHNIGVEFQWKSFMRLTLDYGLTTDQITSLTLLDKETGIRRTSPANIDGNWNTNSYLFFTTTLRDVTVSMTANHTYNHNVSYVQSTTDESAQKSVTKCHNVSTGLSAGYGNKSWLMSTEANYSLNHSKSDYLSDATVGHEVNVTANITYQSSFGLEVGTTCRLRKPFGYGMKAANKAECIWGLTAEYRFLKNKTATLRLDWRDILNSYNGFQASMSSTSWNESRTYGDTSMFVITFSYKLNDFN